MIRGETDTALDTQAAIDNLQWILDQPAQFPDRVVPEEQLRIVLAAVRGARAALKYMVSAADPFAREIRIATLVEVAKLSCCKCKDERTILAEPSLHPIYRTVIVHETAIGLPLCDAEPIILKLVEEWS